MTVLVVLLVIAGIVGLAVVSYAVHEHSMEKYDYSPFNPGMGGLMLAVVVMFLVAALAAPEGIGWGEFFTRLATFDWTGMSNSAVAFVVALAGVVCSYCVASSKSSIWIGLYCVTLMLALSVLLVVLVFAAAALKSNTKKKGD